MWGRIGHGRGDRRRIGHRHGLLLWESVREKANPPASARAGGFPAGCILKYGFGYESGRLKDGIYGAIDSGGAQRLKAIEARLCPVSNCRWLGFHTCWESDLGGIPVREPVKNRVAEDGAHLPKVRRRRCEFDARAHDVLVMRCQIDNCTFTFALVLRIHDYNFFPQPDGRFQ
jgi:hypothetical protein